ncbi:MAG: hypothetical protein ABI778_10505 [Ignavibacteriota bacterium]
MPENNDKIIEKERPEIPDFSDVKYWYCRRKLIMLGATVDQAIYTIGWYGIDPVYKELMKEDGPTV